MLIRDTELLSMVENLGYNSIFKKEIPHEQLTLKLQMRIPTAETFEPLDETVHGISLNQLYGTGLRLPIFRLS